MLESTLYCSDLFLKTCQARSLRLTGGRFRLPERKKTTPHSIQYYAFHQENVKDCQRESRGPPEP
jgi:hypothetical protein